MSPNNGNGNAYAGVGEFGDLPAGFDGAAGPAVRVIKGEPDDVELAALVAGIVAAHAVDAGADVLPAPSSAWGDRSRAPGAVTGPSPTAWRWSSHPA